MATLVTTITETLRYKGKLGQWSWVLHRVTGLGVVLFLILHVIDTSWAAFYPGQYAKAIGEYQSPLFTLGEFALVAAIIYHAMNGLRIVLFDFKPEWWHLQQKAAMIVLGASVVLLVPTFAIMFGHVLHYYDGNPDLVTISDIIQSQAQFLLGFVVIIAAALLLSLAYALITGETGTPARPNRRPSQFDAWMWRFMRLSGLLIVPLVFGHLAMVHLIQGVFDITTSGHSIVGTDAVNSSGKAVEFVGRRWDYLVAGVAIWRIYDGALLALVVVHGFNGLRYVVNDYAHDRVVRRALTLAIAFGAAALIILGFAALLAGVDETAYGIAKEGLESFSKVPTSPFGG
ncbi:MAG: succinate dehydrogenase, cytochrome b556 subunit [Chloroflexi bacterium]|nr:succinate dehydrogenase, cytochrome b556 subunit [Chloroflexota bacterium]